MNWSKDRYRVAQVTRNAAYRTVILSRTKEKRESKEQRRRDGCVASYSTRGFCLS